jgi:hypothetical protein
MGSSKAADPWKDLFERLLIDPAAEIAVTVEDNAAPEAA